MHGPPPCMYGLKWRGSGRTPYGPPPQPAFGRSCAPRAWRRHRNRYPPAGSLRSEPGAPSPGRASFMSRRAGRVQTGFHLISRERRAARGRRPSCPLRGRCVSLQASRGDLLCSRCRTGVILLLQSFLRFSHIARTVRSALSVQASSARCCSARGAVRAKSSHSRFSAPACRTAAFVLRKRQPCPMVSVGSGFGLTVCLGEVPWRMDDDDGSGLARDGSEAVEGSAAPGRVSRPGGGQRRWTEAEKARIVAESRVPHATVVGVLARHGISTWSLSRWRCRAREGSLGVPEPRGAPPGFVPVVVDDAVPDREVTIKARGVVVRLPGDSAVDRIVGVAAGLGRGSR